MYLGPTDPESISYDPAVARQPAMPFSANVRDMNPIPPVPSRSFAQLAMGCSNPPLYQLCGNDSWGGFIVGSDVEAIGCLGRTSVRLHQRTKDV